MEQLDGRVAVVTGGAGGIGLARCRSFEAAAREVLVSDGRADAEALIGAPRHDHAPRCRDMEAMHR